MPNPLLVATSTPTTPAKSDAALPESRASKGSATFQDVLEQDTPEIGTVIPQEAEPDPKIEADEDAELGEVPEAPLALRESPTPLPQAPDRQPKDSDTAQGPLTVAGQKAPPSPPPSELGSDAQPQPIVRAPEPRSPIGMTVIRPTPASGPEEPQRPLPERHGALKSAGAVPSQDIKPNSASPDSLPPAALAGTPPPSGPPNQPATPDRAPSLVQMQLFAASNSDLRRDTSTERSAELPAMAGDAIAHPNARETLPAAIPTLTSARAETARAIAGQMAAVVNARPGSGTVELALNPEELGRVSIVLNTREDGMHMTIAAERPETLDLMRRHMSILAGEFQKLGLGDLSLDLGTSPDAQQDNPDARDSSQFDAPSPEIEMASDPVINKTRPDGGIDMRL